MGAILSCVMHITCAHVAGLGGFGRLGGFGGFGGRFPASTQRNKCVAKRHRKFQATISVNGKPHILGSFFTLEEAALCYARHLGPERSATEAAEVRDGVWEHVASCSIQRLLPRRWELVAMCSIQRQLPRRRTGSGTAMPLLHR